MSAKRKTELRRYLSTINDYGRLVRYPTQNRYYCVQCWRRHKKSIVQYSEQARAIYADSAETRVPAGWPKCPNCCHNGLWLPRNAMLNDVTPSRVERLQNKLDRLIDETNQLNDSAVLTMCYFNGQLMTSTTLRPWQPIA